jgi:hypothetical protein
VTLLYNYPSKAYFDAVSTEFEMKERIDTINQKIDYASEVQSTLRALLTEVGIPYVIPRACNTTDSIFALSN